MCDYSLHHVATRPAKLEDKLVTTKFTNSITRGFAAVGEPQVAVCLLPGERPAQPQLAFAMTVERRRINEISAQLERAALHFDRRGHIRKPCFKVRVGALNGGDL